jgi:ADP-heptose:LPS heptosyltransferase
MAKSTKEMFTPRTNLTVYASMCMLDKIIPYEQMSLPLWPELSFYDETDTHAYKDLEENVRGVDFSRAVILPVSFRSHSKKWNQTLLDEFVNYLLHNNRIPICVGGVANKDNPLVAEKFHSKSVIVSKNAIDLVGKISIKQTLALMQRSAAIVGVTGGLIQLAGLTVKPIVTMITYTDAFHSLFWRGGEFAKNVYPLLPSEKSCAFCVNDYLVNHMDYNDCLLNKNFECTSFALEHLVTEFENAINSKPSPLQQSISAYVKANFG